MCAVNGLGLLLWIRVELTHSMLMQQNISKPKQIKPKGPPLWTISSGRFSMHVQNMDYHIKMETKFIGNEIDFREKVTVQELQSRTLPSGNNAPAQQNGVSPAGHLGICLPGIVRGLTMPRTVSMTLISPGEGGEGAGNRWAAHSLEREADGAFQSI